MFKRERTYVVFYTAHRDTKVITGRCDINLDTPINSMGIIKAIEHGIEEKHNLTNLVLTGWKLLK